MTIKNRWIQLALTAVLVAFAGLTGCGGDDGELATATDAAFVPDASPLTTAFSPLDPGSYRVDTVGTPFSFTIDESLHVQPNGNGLFVLTAPGSRGPDDRDIVVLRLSHLSEPSRLVSTSDVSDREWSSNEFEAWLDDLTDEIEISNRQDTSLGGLDATYVELRMSDDAECPVGEPCTILGTNNRIETKFLAPGSTYRIWMVDQGEEDALAVIVGINREADVDWFDTADEVLATLAFGAVAPNPVFAVEGPLELSFLGGIHVELTESAIVVEEPGGYGAIRPPDVPGDVEFLVAPTEPDGTPVGSIDDLVAVLDVANVDVTELEAEEIGGLPARVFELGATEGPPLLTRAAGSGALWLPPPRGRMWLVEHPDRGLLVVTAEAFTDPDNVFPTVLAMAEPIVASMEFVDLG